MRVFELPRQPLLLAFAVIAAYAVSLQGGFLNYDDGWLIAGNPFLRGDFGALRAIWFDLGAETRQKLGAEYLPVRDTVLWIQAQVFGVVPQAFRVCSLGLYLAAALILRAYLVRTLPDRAVGEGTAWLFALHPAHAESVAWLAGQKDVLALLFVVAAVASYGSPRRGWVAATPLLVGLAVLGKSVAVVSPVLLLLHDFLTARRPRWIVLAASAVVAGAGLVVHLEVGRLVGMMAPWPAGGRMAMAATMGPVWIRSLARAFFPMNLSVQYEVPDRAAWDLGGWLAYAVLLALAGAAAWLWRRGDRLWLWALGWFVVPLLPTSQVLAPLQNRMADRYLLLAALGPSVVWAALCRRGAEAIAPKASRFALGAPLIVLVILFAGLTAERAHLFADSARLWQDALSKTARHPLPPYQLALALEAAGRSTEAEGAYRTAIARAAPAADEGRAAANNLSALLIGHRRLAEARAVLRQAIARYPQDPKLHGNLAEVTARLGDHAEARRLFLETLRRFPTYQPARRNYQRHYGSPLDR